MNAGLPSTLFWITLPVSLIVSGVAAFPVSLWLINRGRGHAAVHQHVPHVRESTMHGPAVALER
jgi:hypothetical protein